MDIKKMHILSVVGMTLVASFAFGISMPSRWKSNLQGANDVYEVINSWLKKSDAEVSYKGIRKVLQEIEEGLCKIDIKLESTKTLCDLDDALRYLHDSIERNPILLSASIDASDIGTTWDSILLEIGTRLYPSLAGDEGEAKSKALMRRRSRLSYSISKLKINLQDVDDLLMVVEGWISRFDLEKTEVQSKILENWLHKVRGSQITEEDLQAIADTIGSWCDLVDQTINNKMQKDKPGKKLGKRAMFGYSLSQNERDALQEKRTCVQSVRDELRSMLQRMEVYLNQIVPTVHELLKAKASLKPIEAREEDFQN